MTDFRNWKNPYHGQLKADNIREFIEIVTEKAGVPPGFEGSLLYRGQRQYQRLLPVIARYEWPHNPGAEEKRIFADFKVRAADYIPASVQQLDCLALARHHGLPTRLLDWTENSLAALYFATRHDDARPNEPISVWRLCVTNDFIVERHGNPFDTPDDFKVFQPAHIDARISGQLGWFSIHPIRTDFGPADYKSWYVDLKRRAEEMWRKSQLPNATPEEKSKIGMIDEIILHSPVKKIREDLGKLGIHNALLFPGIDGICQSLKECRQLHGYGDHATDAR